MISFIFPIYKQEHILKKSIDLLEKYLSDKPQDQYEVIICIDGSPDNCLQIAKSLASDYKNVVVAGYEKNKGRGYAVKYAGMVAKGDYFICMDCDLITKKYFVFIDQMIDLVKRHDVVIASRFHKQSRIERKFIRKIVSKCYRVLVSLMFRRFIITDPDVGFKGVKRGVFNKVNLESNLNGPSWELQFLVNAQYEKYDIYEFPFHYVEDYERTTVNVLACSFVELMGMIYVRFTRFISDRMVF